ncbi:DUF397 domain-containing protein [Saccharopolyspora sp. NFXS83]|uniref:DUF397 domain-containing protein n=1 Tax=Saccharopolyspora sp. NFXS83 TaxID=2993560 RepID=UPI00224B4E7D|nr:DUF397 domain-containing protein [Saccharopolyspora sp. NFXS83]MCX2729085.1 DUF397 domain-containing protein [Saccharopolyspora sp. NFXS83]
MAPEISRWRTSTRSAPRGACVEVGGAPGIAAVRDTKDRDAGTLTFTPTAWAGFLTHLRTGHLDHPRT